MANTAKGTPYRLAAGKIAPGLLAPLLARLPVSDPGLITGPGVGEDAAVLEMRRDDDQWIVAKSDPITFATEEIGHYALHVCANDLAVTGAEPRFFLPTVLLPAGQTAASDVEAVFDQLARSSAELGVTVAGGHTEVTDAVSRVVIAGTLLGSAPRGGTVTTGGARPGDCILLAGVWPVEAISLIARERRAELMARGWSAAELQTAADYLYDPGISVTRPALAAARSGLVTAMHDPTEGGIATALAEVAQASGAGLRWDLETMACPPLARRLCAEFDLDPLGCIASGCLLCAAGPEDAPALEELFTGIGWPVSRVGEITAAGELQARRGGRQVAWPRFAADEVTRLFA